MLQKLEDQTIGEHTLLQCYEGFNISMFYLNLFLLNAKKILKENTDHIKVTCFWDEYLMSQQF